MATAKKRSASSNKTLVTDLQTAAKQGKKKLAAALQLIGKLRGQGTESYDELWEQVRDVLEAEPALWRHGDYRPSRGSGCAAYMSGASLDESRWRLASLLVSHN